jgi:hypothetical protein
MIKKVKEEDKWHSWEDVKKEINLWKNGNLKP